MEDNSKGVIEMKKCNKCGEEKSVYEFYKDKKTNDGLYFWCKACIKEYKDLHKEEMSEYQKIYYQTNKEEIIEKKKVYRVAHKEEIAKKKKAYQQANKEEISRKGKIYYQANKEEISRKGKIYRKTERSMAAKRKSSRKRRAFKVSIKENFTTEQETFVKNRFNSKCFNCGSTEKLHLDHHFPLSKGNPLTIKNAVVLCEYCNISKSDKDPEDFYTYDKLTELELKLGNNNCRWNLKKYFQQRRLK